MVHKVLLVDDEPHVTEGLKRSLRREPYEILCASSAEEGMRILARESIDVVISDEKMPGTSGAEFLSRVRKEYPDTIRMILSGQADLDAAIRAINEGEIFRFLTKPCSELELAMAVRHALQQKSLLSETQRLLRVAESQSATLKNLEEKHPGIARVNRSAEGAIILEDEDLDPEQLIRQISEELDKSMGRRSGPGTQNRE